MKQNLYPKKLLDSLNKFVQYMHVLDLADNPKLVSQLVLKWTKAQPLLTKKLLQYILESKQKISLGEEAATVEKVIRNRLIKEFKPDELTLPIRKLLYTKDLIVLLKKCNNRIGEQEDNYLKRLQDELSLSVQQVETIKENYLQYTTTINTSSQPKYQSSSIITTSINNQVEDSYQDLIFLIENSPVYDQLADSNVAKKANPLKLVRWEFFKQKSLWLCLAIPLILLLIKNSNWKKNAQIITTTDIVQQNNCADFTFAQSSQMSLGEELLTQQDRQLPPASQIALYEATAAFARCEYSIAQSKFKTALDLEQNNPEALIYFNNARAITNDHLKIAVIVSLDKKPEIAWEILRGVAQAQTEINRQGGVKGKLLLVQIVDDVDDPEMMRQIAEQLTVDRKILAVINDSDSQAAVNDTEIYQQQGLVMISPTSGTKLSSIGNYIMQITPSISVLADTLSSYALFSSFNKIAICLDSHNADSKAFAQEFAAKIIEGEGNIVSVGCDLAQENFNPIPVVEQAIAQNVKALLLAASPDKINQAVSVAQANQNRLPLLGNHSLYTFETIQTGQKAVANMVLSTPWLPDTIPNSDFSEATMEFWGGKVNWRTAMAYDATQAIIQGLKQSDTRSELQAILTNPDFSVNGATGRFRFEQGDRVGKVQLAYIAKLDPDSDRYQFLQLDLKSKI